jgi:hypothetical protein
MSNDYLLENVEGYEMMPDWYAEQLKAQEFELHLIESGYYKSFNPEIEVAA